MTKATEKQIALMEKLDIEMEELIEEAQALIDNAPKNTRFTCVQGPALIEEMKGEDDMSVGIREKNPSQHISLAIDLKRTVRSALDREIEMHKILRERMDAK
jgi:hypothetical protein